MFRLYATFLEANNNLLDIPLPSSKLMHKPYKNISLANESMKKVQADAKIITDDLSKEDNFAPFRLNLKQASKQNSGSDVSNDASGFFESFKDSSNDSQRVLPKLQAMMKRSKPNQLPVGVLPSKAKLPPSEIKTDLFLPTKENEINSLTGDLMKMSNYSSSKASMNDADDSLSNALREIDALNNFAQFASGTLQSTGNLSLPMNSLNSTSIPNLMSLSVAPVHSNSLMGGRKEASTHPKISSTIMKYVNPQKFRSAQMIATPLIANPALATQSKHSDDSRRRSRSRSHRRKRSRSRRRSNSRHRLRSRRKNRRHRSSSSSGSRHHSSKFSKKSKDDDDERERSRSHRNREHCVNKHKSQDDGDACTNRKGTNVTMHKQTHSKDILTDNKSHGRDLKLLSDENEDNRDSIICTNISKSGTQSHHSSENECLMKKYTSNHSKTSKSLKSENKKRILKEDKADKRERIGESDLSFGEKSDSSSSSSINNRIKSKNHKLKSGSKVSRSDSNDSHCSSTTESLSRSDCSKSATRNNSGSLQSSKSINIGQV